MASKFYAESCKQLEICNKSEDFCKPNAERDFPLLVEKKKIFVNKDILAAASPIWRQMLALDDLGRTNKSCLELQGKKVADVLEFVRIGCSSTPKSVDDITFDNVTTLMEFAKEFQMKNLEFDCAEFFKRRLADMPVGDELVVDILLPAAKYPFVDIVDKCVPYAAALTADVFEYFRDRLPLYVLAAILDAKVKRLEGEQHIWKWTGPFKHARKCQYCNNRSKRYCKKCEICNRHRDVSIKCPGFHDDKCRAIKNHLGGCHNFELNEDDPNLSACLCGNVSCLCGFNDYDKEYLKFVFEIEN